MWCDVLDGGRFLSKFFEKKRKGKMGTKRIVRTEIGEGLSLIHI